MMSWVSMTGKTLGKVKGEGRWSFWWMVDDVYSWMFIDLVFSGEMCRWVNQRCLGMFDWCLMDLRDFFGYINMEFRASLFSENSDCYKRFYTIKWFFWCIVRLFLVTCDFWTPIGHLYPNIYDSTGFEP
jgi:hypothetical protein